MIIVNTYGLNIFLGKDCLHLILKVMKSLPYFLSTNSGNRFDSRQEELSYLCNMK